MKTLSAFVVGCSALLLAQVQLSAQSSLLELSPLPGMADLAADKLSISYDAGSGLFQVIGSTFAYTPPNSDGSGLGVGGPNPAYLTDFNLTAHVNSSGQLFGSGSFSASGDYVNDPGFKTLLTGNLTAFESQLSADLGNLYAFGIVITGGALAADFGGANSQAVSIVIPWTLAGGDWSTSFSNYNVSSRADVFANPVPEPSMAALLLACGALWSAGRRLCR